MIHQIIKTYGIKRKPNVYGVGGHTSVSCGTVGHPTRGVWFHTPHNHLIFS